MDQSSALANDRIAGGTADAKASREAIRPWNAEWVTAPGVDLPTGSIPGMDGSNRQAPAETLLLRKSFVLAGPVKAHRLRIASDSRHVVWINGVEILRGPLRSQPQRLAADEMDVSTLLRAGENTIAVRVTYYGTPNAVWMPARSSGGLGTSAAMIAELSGPDGEPVVVTDQTWLVARSHATTRLPRTDVEGIPAEIHDGRLLDADWMNLPRDVSWSRAALLPVGHLSGGGRARPPAEPYGALPSVERTYAPSSEAVAISVNHYRARLGREAQSDGDHPSERVRSARAAQETEPSDSTLIVYDFGRIVFGVVELILQSPAGVAVDIDLREDVRLTPAAVSHGVRYLTSGADDRFATSEPHGFRVATVLVHGRGSSDAGIPTLTVREERPNRPGGAAFFSNDDELNAIWDAGVRTVAISTTDAYIDCPTREQRAWVGDGVVHLEVDLYTNADRTMAKRYVQLAASPRPDGLLPMSVAGDVEDAGSATIPAWSLHWIHGVHLYAQHEGIDDVVREALPVIERVLRWFLPYRDRRGTLQDVPGWNLVDWSSVYTDGRSSILTGLWGRALREYATLCEAVGNAASARWARGLYDAASVGFEDFWDARRGIYLDRVDDGDRRSRAASQLASAAAIVSGFAPRSRWMPVCEAISDERALLTRTWLGDPDHGFDGAALESWLSRHPDPDWNVDQQIIRAEPFGASVVHDALGYAGASPQLVSAIRGWSIFLTDGYDTFGEGWGWGTHSHGWSCSPTRDLFAHIIGARPIGYSAERWRLRPRLGLIHTAEAQIVTGRGTLTVKVTPPEIFIDSPVTLEVHGVGERRILEPGEYRLAREN
ncbi:hypothetical protein DXT68_14255 [Microbacterium foliorum]|uniref:Bacterial alpha-L-rhamnosidase n=2 Tax=Microbacterium foliorum TaxID=104336 RepID=A0A0F0KLU1_9MICO|nr:family 78 glycoside hydrolase catalytic domain [Microbacterium foliorum]AXL13167.1 hypothetical protein DXT68_14255 [Microbacterium foliorum]KJL21130.1 Bacterial alpha-L-rhamnosidase [Microbacterium foliorum]